jgi:hypothetical protein
MSGNPFTILLVSTNEVEFWGNLVVLNGARSTFVPWQMG